MLKYICQVISQKKRRNITILEDRDDLFKLSLEIGVIYLIEDMLDWSKTAASSGTFACKCIIEDGKMEDKSCKPVLENKEWSWLCEWFFDVLWQDWQNGSFKCFLNFAYW